MRVEEGREGRGSKVRVERKEIKLYIQFIIED